MIAFTRKDGPWIVRAVLFVVAVGLVPGVARGENALRLDERRFVTLQRRLDAQDSVRVHTARGAIVVPWPELTADSIVTRGPDVVPRLGLLDAQRIDGRGNLAWTGAIIGAGVSAGLSLVVLLACDHCNHGFANVAGFTAGSAGAGGVTGALIGLPITRWRTLYRAPETKE